MVRMFTELRVRNFQGFQGEHSLQLRRLTLVFGPNSSGKSALLHALALLRQSVPASPVSTKEPLLFKGPLVDLGDFRNVVHGHGTHLNIGLGFTHLVDTDMDETPFEPQAVDLDFSWNPQRHACEVKRLLYSLPDDRTKDVHFRVGGSYSEDPPVLRVSRSRTLRTVTSWAAESIERRMQMILRRQGVEASIVAPTRREVDRWTYQSVVDATLDVWGFLPRHVHPDPPDASDPEMESRVRYEAMLRWSSMLQQRAVLIYEALQNVTYIGPVRSSPQRYESNNAALNDYVGPAGEVTARLLNANAELLEQVNVWLEQLEIPYSVSVHRISTKAYPSLGGLLALELTDRRTNVAVSPLDVGFGISQVLPVVAQLLVGGGRSLLIEQPEIHLHPRLQARLGSLFVEALCLDPDMQIIAETHSELLILRIQSLIAKGALSADDVQVVYVGAGPSGSWIEELPLSAQGHFLKEWPGGFFEERYDEWLS